MQRPMSQYQDDNEWEDWGPSKASSSVMPKQKMGEKSSP
jgi:ribosome-associated protein